MGTDDASLPVAAVDLGSNSFHMVIGRVLGNELSVLDRLREPVRIAGGLDDHGRLAPDAVERMTDCLERFGQRLRDLPHDRVRAIGTASLRRTRKPKNILTLAGDALGHPIDVLSGAEEARLIYLGVSHDQPRIEGNRLVVDIGGASTEVILGLGFGPIFADSLQMGCVVSSQRFFPDGVVTRGAFRSAIVAARLELETLERRFVARGWTECVGSSGTIHAVSRLLAEARWTDGTITAEALSQLRRTMIDAGSMNALQLVGLSEDRRPVLAGGVAILTAVFKALRIDSMHYSKAALREGVLYDLLGRIRHEDVRDRTIGGLSERYHVDEQQAVRVERVALDLLDKTADAWDLDRVEGGQLLGWAARAHEIGLAIAYAGHHRHGAYILANSNLAGFSRQEQARLAALVRGHRRKLTTERFVDVAERWLTSTFRLCVLLRLAVRLCRGRGDGATPELEAKADGKSLDLFFPDEWLGARPLTRADLEEEVLALERAGVRLRVNPSD